jgi:hypothetical protein
MLTEAEIAALLALPPAAAVALERCPGPGWSVSDTSADLYPENPWPDGRRGRTWCPADCADILALVPVEPGCGVGIYLADGEWHAGRGALTPTERRDVTAPTARLAALRLLALTA